MNDEESSRLCYMHMHVVFIKMWLKLVAVTDDYEKSLIATAEACIFNRDHALRLV